jgi:hypothetical protein
MFLQALGCLLYTITYLKSTFDGESKLEILNGNYYIRELPRYNSTSVELIKDMLTTTPDRPLSIVAIEVEAPPMDTKIMVR